MKIVINDEVLGEFTDDGEIVTDDIWLKKLANKISNQKLTDFRTKKTKQGHYSYIVKATKGNPGYYSAIAELLLDNGYGLKE